MNSRRKHKMNTDPDLIKFFSGTHLEKVNDNQLRLSDDKVITFNEQQYEGIKRIREWLKTKNESIFILMGSAGVGKSTVVKKILDEYNRGVVVSAPTHKALKVLTRISKREGLTLQSLLGLRPDTDIDSFNPNDPIFAQISVPKINDYNFVLIDESSMINKELYVMIDKLIKNTNTKVLFMGDPAQAPPVGEKESYIFSEEMLANNQYYILTIIERQNNTNPLLDIYTNLRNNLVTLDGGFLRKTIMNDKGEGAIFLINKREFRKLVLEKFKSEEFKKDIDYCRLIAWKNNTVMESNKIIRDELFGQITDIVEIGDVLMGYRSISDEKMRYNIIQNSADYKIIKRGGKIKNSYNLYGFNVTLSEEDFNGNFLYRNVFILDANDENNLFAYARIHDNLRDIAKANKKEWFKYYEFRRCNILLKTIDKYDNGQIRSSYDRIVKDMDYGYSITTHKSQGSTYQHVMVLETDLNFNWSIKERNQLKYVSLTRPTKSAIILTSKLD